jgi:hypothetical protein
MTEKKSKPKGKGTSRVSKPAKKATKTANAGARSSSQPKSGAKTKPQAGSARPVKLLSGGNPQIAKADGDAPVQAYIAAMPGWKQGVGRRLDALIVRTLPDVRKAVRWNSPFYGVEGQGWFLSFHVFTRYVKSPSSAARRCARSRPAPASTRRRAISTSTRTTTSTRRSSRPGSSRPPRCPAGYPSLS